MTPAFLAFTLVASYIVAALAALFLGGQLVRHDRTRSAARSTSPIIEDLRWLQALVVDFFARTNPFARLLSILTAHQHPLPANELSQKASGDARPEGIEWAALWIMRLGGLVRFTHDGILATDVGRGVQQRITTPAKPRREREFRRCSTYDSLFVPIPIDTSASSHLQRVGAVSRGRPPEFLQREHAVAVTDIGQLRKAATASNRSRIETTSMKKPKIIMTTADHEELTSAIAAAGNLSERGHSETNALKTEIARAKIVDASDLPPDVITMNSRAELLDLDTGERMEFTLVLPIHADIEAGKISILTPLGTAMLGCRVRDEFEWPVPYGLRRLKVMHVHFQPEAVLKKAA